MMCRGAEDTDVRIGQARGREVTKLYCSDFNRHKSGHQADCVVWHTV